eukprot:TRINITY_DN3785_c1_g1_i1.p1 TRINITY_DN3785_c1_g1~~TRINITY_DN3785_c1_g1_i1.p1  ORF type:complete len:217 (+),score=44.67 TRINITY_DN3785_c1_g1_i1:162-812(+)
MGNRVRHFCSRNQVREIHIKRPLKCAELSENANSPVNEVSSPAKNCFFSQDETISLKTCITPEYKDGTMGIEFQNEENVNSSNLVKAQQKLISKLEIELKSVQNELVKVKNSSEQKILKSQSKTANLRAETALLVFELREKISELESENHDLLTKLHNSENSDQGDMNIIKAHSELVLTLSEQLLSANEKLKDANDQIKYLKQNGNTQEINSDDIT